MSWLGGSRPITFTQPELLMVIVTVVICYALHLFLSRSRLGKAMRAMSDNADLAMARADEAMYTQKKASKSAAE